MASSACVACELNSYKSQPGNLEACTPCPSGFTTFTTGSVWASSCQDSGDIPSNPGVGVSNDSGNGSVDNETDSGNSTPQLQPVLATQNESSVPALTFNMSLSNFPVQGAGDLREQLKATQHVQPKTCSISYFCSSRVAHAGPCAHRCTHAFAKQHEEQHHGTM